MTRTMSRLTEAFRVSKMEHMRTRGLCRQSFLSTPLTHTHTMHTLAVKPKRLNQPTLGPSLYRRPSYTMYIALVFAASPDVLGYHASETIDVTSVLLYLHPRASKTIGFPIDFQLFAPTWCQNHCLCQILAIFHTKMFKQPLVLPDFPDRFCKKPNKTIGFTRFSGFLKLFQGYTAPILLYGCMVLKRTKI